MEYTLNAFLLVPCPLEQEGRSAAESRKVPEKVEDEEEGEEEEEEEDDEEAQDLALPPKSLLWGTLVLGVVAASIVTLVALGRRR